MQANSGELSALSRTLNDRESAIKSGMIVQETRYEVTAACLALASALALALALVLALASHVLGQLQMTVHVLQVHRFHPPLAYGRTMDGSPETSEGCALYAASKGPTGCQAFAVITYRSASTQLQAVPSTHKLHALSAWVRVVQDCCQPWSWHGGYVATPGCLSSCSAIR